MSREEKIKALELLEEADARVRYNKINTIFPDEGPLSYKNYPKHMKFFAAGATFNERAMIAANRSGKSLACGCEMVYHLTGLYPHWWEGRRFYEPIKAWAVGDTSDTVRDIIQTEILLGSAEDPGTGLIPKHLIVRTTRKSGAGSDYVQDIYVKHVTGRNSILTLKTYQQEIEAFYGAARHVVWLDEESPPDIYSECLTRTMTVDGIMILSFTPLKSLSETVLRFLPGGMFPATPDRCGPVEEKD